MQKRRHHRHHTGSNEPQELAAKRQKEDHGFLVYYQAVPEAFRDAPVFRMRVPLPSQTSRQTLKQPSEHFATDV